MQTQLANRPLDLAAPVVVPTRRRLDRRFPSLGLTITTTAPWVEVLLSTDPVLFDPARSGSRNEANFYASRTHGGLTPTVSGRARYVVPAAVIAKLASAADSLWYLAVAYPDSTGQGGVPSVTSGANGSVALDAALAQAPGSSVGRGLDWARHWGEAWVAGWVVDWAPTHGWAPVFGLRDRDTRWRGDPTAPPTTPAPTPVPQR